MKKALHGNTPNLQTSVVRAPTALLAEASHSNPAGKQGKPGNTLGTVSGCKTSARHSLWSEEWVGLSTEVWGTHWPRFPADLGFSISEPGGKATDFSSPCLPPLQLGNCPNLCHLLKVPYKPQADVNWNPAPRSKQVSFSRTVTETKLQVGPINRIWGSRPPRATVCSKAGHHGMEQP